MPRILRILCLLCVLAVVFTAPAPAQAAPTAGPPAVRVVILGTGTPNADPERSGPSVAVVVGDEAYLFDAGPGIVRRAAAAKKESIEALDSPNLKRVFLTHLHSDHTLGLPDLIFSPENLRKTAGGGPACAAQCTATGAKSRRRCAGC